MKNTIRFKTGLDISVTCVITYTIAHNYAKIKVDSYDSLPLEKAMTFQFGINIKITTAIVYF